MSLTSVLDSLAESSSALAAVLPSFHSVDDTALLATQQRLAEARRRIDSASAAVADEVARRSHRDLGYAGLAQRLGARTPEALVQQVSGVSRREAAVLVRVGALIGSESPVSAPLTAGALSVEAADVITLVLGEPSETIPASSIAAASQSLIDVAPTLTLEQLAGRARLLRDELDSAGVELRESKARDARYLRLTPQRDGMVRLAGLLDPESAALVTDAFDAVTSPRRGGPRFVDRPQRARAAALETDPRTLDQLMADTFVEIVRVATAADPIGLFGQHWPAVRVIVAERDLARSSGAAHLEGASASVSLATAARIACDTGIQPIVAGDEGDVLRLGRSQRLFSGRQRLALAARDGGCRFPGCDRPPSWCEAHHIRHWSAGGRTDIADGMLLCRHHHLLAHNNGWSIERRGGEYLLIPPAGVDAARTPIPMPTKSAAWAAVARAG